MKCYQHQDTDSIGICKACQKAVCQSCVIDTGRGLACSPECEAEVHDMNAIIDKSKRIYSIGSSSKLPPTGIIMYFMFSLLFIAWGTYNTLHWTRPDYFTLLMGAAFLLITVMAYFRNRKLNINC